RSVVIVPFSWIVGKHPAMSLRRTSRSTQRGRSAFRGYCTFTSGDRFVSLSPINPPASCRRHSQPKRWVVVGEGFLAHLLHEHPNTRIPRGDRHPRPAR